MFSGPSSSLGAALKTLPCDPGNCARGACANERRGAGVAALKSRPMGSMDAAPDANETMQSPAPQRAVAWWLLACCALIFAMVVVGGITRLTHSGLSIVEWQPVVGAIPPLDDASGTRNTTPISLPSSRCAYSHQ